MPRCVHPDDSPKVCSTKSLEDVCATTRTTKAESIMKRVAKRDVILVLVFVPVFLPAACCLLLRRRPESVGFVFCLDGKKRHRKGRKREEKERDRTWTQTKREREGVCVGACKGEEGERMAWRKGERVESDSKGIGDKDPLAIDKGVGTNFDDPSGSVGGNELNDAIAS